MNSFDKLKKLLQEHAEVQAKITSLETRLNELAAKRTALVKEADFENQASVRELTNLQIQCDMIPHKITQHQEALAALEAETAQALQQANPIVNQMCRERMEGERGEILAALRPFIRPDAASEAIEAALNSVQRITRDAARADFLEGARHNALSFANQDRPMENARQLLAAIEKVQAAK